MDQPPRHFHANERFFIEISFEEPLPEGAIPLAEFAGPIGPGGPALTFWTATSGPAENAEADRRRVRLIGKVPAEAPPGMYRVTHVEVRWTDRDAALVGSRGGADQASRRRRARLGRRSAGALAAPDPARRRRRVIGPVRMSRVARSRRAARADARCRPARRGRRRRRRACSGNGSAGGGAALSLGLFKLPVVPLSADLTVAVPFNGGYATTVDARFAFAGTAIGAGVGFGTVGAAQPATGALYDALIAQGIAPHTALQARVYFGPAARRRCSRAFASRSSPSTVR